MTAGLDDVIAILDRAIAGQTISFEEVQSLRWSVKPEHDPLLQRIYRELQMFASDADIRKKDSDYGKAWRDGLSALRENLLDANKAS